MNQRMFAAGSVVLKRVLIASFLLSAFVSCRSANTSGTASRSVLDKRAEVPASPRKEMRKSTKAMDFQRLEFDVRPSGDLVPVIGRDNGLSLF